MSARTRDDEPHPQERSIEGVVRYVEDYGNRYGVYIQVEGDKNELIAIREGEIPQPGEKVYIHVETEKLHLFDRGTEKSLRLPGDGDPRTGKAGGAEIGKDDRPVRIEIIERKSVFKTRFLNVYFEEETCNHEKNSYQH